MDLKIIPIDNRGGLLYNIDMKKWITLSIIVLGLMIIFVYYTHTYWGWFKTVDVASSQAEIQPQILDEELVALANNVGITKEELIRDKISLAMVGQEVIDNEYPGQGLTGSFKISYKENGNYNHSTIKIVRGSKYQQQVLAHEYMHYIWAVNKGVSEDTVLSSKLMTEYATSNLLQKWTSSYSENNNLNTNELWAYSCSGIKQLDQYIADKCSKYINRTALVLY